MICLSCSNCKYYTMKNGDSYCTKKREILTFLERNWVGSWSEYEFTCFRPSPKTGEYLEKHYEKLGLNDAKELSALFRQNFGLKRENEQLIEENKQLHYKIIELQDKLGMSEKVIGDE